MTNVTTIRLPFLFYKKNGVKKPTWNLEAKPLSRSEQIATDIIHLYETYGIEKQEGEALSQTAHMVQCAMLAMENMSDLPVIIGALLHDIGHLIGQEESIKARNEYGWFNYAGTGATYLRRNGFSERVCAIVEQQVEAKRYLITTDHTYRTKLSAASLQSLRWQGGIMTAEEVAAFERHPYFTDIINVRRWNEAAKSNKTDLLPANWFYRLIWDHLFLRVV